MLSKKRMYILYWPLLRRLLLRQSLILGYTNLAVDNAIICKKGYLKTYNLHYNVNLGSKLLRILLKITDFREILDME